MDTETLYVPFSVLNKNSHNANTRLVWMLQHTQPEKQSGLDRRTIAQARTALARAPLAPCHSRFQPSCAAIPVALLKAESISASAKLLYGQLQAVPNVKRDKCSTTYADLSHLTGTSPATLRRAAADLVAARWLTVTQEHRKRPVTFTRRDPIGRPMRARVTALKRKVRGAKYRGETLMREFLNLMVAVEHPQDDAIPDFLLNPYSHELMELDRYYPSHGVAFEYQGEQHYSITELATLEKTVKQIGRDAMKAFLCKVHGIELIHLHWDDLTHATILHKLPGRLPRRDLTGLEPLITALEDLAVTYRERTADEQARKTPLALAGGRRQP